MGLRKLTDKMKPTFSKGGKLSFLHSTFEAFESFLFVPDKVTTKGVHVRDSIDLKRVMTVVMISLVPCILFGMWNIGYQHNLAIGGDMGFWAIVWYGFLKILPLYLVSYIVGLGIEFTSAQIKGHQVNEGYLVTGLIIPLIIPVTTPLWMLAIAVAFAVIIGKEIFGGTGMNIWNPALLARAFLFFAYPNHMTGDKVWVAGASSAVDAFSGATPLSQTSEGLSGLLSNYSVTDMFFGFIPGSIGETSKVAILLGAIFLIYTGVGSWRTMLSCVLGALFVGVIANLCAPGPNSALAIPAYYHLLLGGFAFGTVFMATDPVSSAQTSAGKWIYGFLIGAVAVTIRLFNPGYPEGMMLSILLANTFAPLIDHYVVQSNIKRRLNRAKTV
ncbi:MAG: NADH:ubiquinone reductase (Na(+)-transporting) subunit B [Bacteroidales bacterium]|nr:NADH:ubiquinone reductase (Na(+)-transporting) subunit B [Bacteroidales bacterium]MDD3201036.1 NADH:ubiquinone reductase (Na(+)-transporting) subunit B [Bacteroidales bacterium]